MLRFSKKVTESQGFEKVKTKLQIINKIKSTTNLYISNRFKNFLSNHFYLMIIVLFFLFLFLYFNIPLLENPTPKTIAHFIDKFFLTVGFPGFGDFTIKYIISITNNLLITTLTILSAMYVFTHREQKTISPSLHNEIKKNNLVIGAIIILVFNFISGHTLVSNLEFYIKQQEISYNHPLHGTKTLIYKLLFWLVGISLAIQWIINLIKYLYTSMNADRMLKISIVHVNNHFDMLSGFYRNRFFDKLLHNQYKFLHHLIESIFQYLKYLGDNNMNEDFDDNIKSLEIVFGKFKSSNDKYKIDNVASYLLNRDQELFLGIFNSLLRNALSLNLHLYKNNHFNKGRKLTTLYFSLFLEGEDRLKQQFILSLNEFLDSIDTSNERQLKDFLTGLKSLPEDSALIIYKNLIHKLIIKGNIGMLTTVVYDFKDHIIDGISEIAPKTNFMSRSIAARNRINLKSNAIIILLQSLVKAIEISQYGTTGFLVKYMITNFDGEEINRAYATLKQRPTSFTSILETLDDKSTNIKDSEIGLVSLNDETFDYCCKKMLILLYGQQLFTKKEKLWFYTKKDAKKYVEINIEEEFKDCTFVNYVLKKVESVGSKHGLLFFEDKGIMNKISSKLIYISIK